METRARRPAAGSRVTSSSQAHPVWSGSFWSLPSSQCGGPATATVLPCDSSGCPCAVRAEAGVEEIASLAPALQWGRWRSAREVGRRLRPQWVRALRVLPSSFLSSVVFTTTLGVRSQPPACAVALAGQHEILLFIDVSVGDTLSTARGRPRTVRFVWR